MCLYLFRQATLKAKEEELNAREAKLDERERLLAARESDFIRRYRKATQMTAGGLTTGATLAALGQENVAPKDGPSVRLSAV